MREGIMNIYMVVIAITSLIFWVLFGKIEFVLPIIWAIYGIITKEKKEKEISLGASFSLLILLLLKFLNIEKDETKRFIYSCS